MKFKILLIGALASVFFTVNAQNYNNLSGQATGVNVITTAVPFLMIGPDARAGGLGDGGVASSADANSMHWNPAKYVWAENKQGFAISYTPWLRNLVNDINLAYVSYYNKLDRMNAIAFSMRYFSLGEIQFTDQNGQSLGYFKPNEFALDATYSRLLTDNLSLAVAGRFIYSNLTAGQTVQGVETTAGISVAADIALYWQKDVNWFKNIDAQFAWGLNISNIGNKMSYTRSNIERDFIPTNLRIGPRLTLDLDDYNKISFQLDINKLLVPTPPIYAWDSTGATIPDPANSNKNLIAAGRDPDVGVIQGMIQSWYDAPGKVEALTDENGNVLYDPVTGAALVKVVGSPFMEELREFNLAFGIEYWYNNLFSVRAGYFWEDKTKGARQYATLGVGLRYNVFGLDFSYLIPTSGVQNPLQNTLRFSLLFNFGKPKTTSAITPAG
ncbi:MAG: type IX secretion system outer membrane channel protein PorV [Chlorobi bacterium]|nr:type IX secretion system outer membrane channel protein PorV [Chlorobiota bacterium]